MLVLDMLKCIAVRVEKYKHSLSKPPGMRRRDACALRNWTPRPVDGGWNFGRWRTTTSPITLSSANTAGHNDIDSMKRKREAGDVEDSSIPKPAAGTVVYSTGKAVKAGLAGGSRQGAFSFCIARLELLGSQLMEAALVAFTQQISTPQSKLPLPLNSPAVVILQQYLDVSAVYEEVFDAWNEGDKVCFNRRRMYHRRR